MCKSFDERIFRYFHRKEGVDAEEEREANEIYWSSEAVVGMGPHVQ